MNKDTSHVTFIPKQYSISLKVVLDIREIRTNSTIRNINLSTEVSTS